MEWKRHVYFHAGSVFYLEDNMIIDDIMNLRYSFICKKNKDPKTLLIGNDEYNKILKSMPHHIYNILVPSHDHDGKEYIYGLEIKRIPCENMLYLL